MNLDDFDALLRKSDPGAPEQVEQERAEWENLVSRRAAFRRQVITYATAAAILMAVGIGWIALSADRENADFAKLEKRASEAVETRDAAPSPSPETLAESNKPSSTERSSEVPSPDEQPAPLETFASFVEHAGPRWSESWHVAVDELRTAKTSAQREAIDLVPALKEATLRERAIDLVCEAAGTSRRDVLQHWLGWNSTRRSCWTKLVTDGNFGQCVALIDAARDDHERRLLCRKFVSARHTKSLDVLTELASRPQWRTTLRRGIGALTPNQVQALTMRMRSRDRNVQMTSAFILASLQGDTVERVASSMILGGRYRHPAYLVLLSRNTPQSNAFLMSAGARQDLSPALISARHHFSAFEGPLKQWLLESHGESDEPQTKKDRVRRRTFVSRGAGDNGLS